MPYQVLFVNIALRRHEYHEAITVATASLYS